MKLGFLTGYSRERIEFARREGFDCVSLVDGGPGAEFDVVSIAEDKIKEIREIADRNHIAITAVAYYTHHIEEAQIQRFRSTIQVAAKLGAKVAATFAGGAPNLKPEENFPRFKEVFSEYTRLAEDVGVKIALENCPCMARYPENIAFNPVWWERIFDAIPSEALGLEFDPSHLVVTGIDYLKALKDFGSKIFHFHAKDAEIDREALRNCGIYGEGWWRFRIPGLGDINWRKIFSVLLDVGYDYAMVIEHEDPVFRGERYDEGLRRGLRYLRQLVR